MTQSILTQERLKELLDYDPETGVFTWKSKRRGRGNVGDIAGNNRGNGYLGISIDGVGYYVHRLAWLYIHGHFPVDDIDHINQIRKDNKLRNLREATRSQNLQNIRHHPKNNKSSDLLGACWHKLTNKWRSQIKLNGRYIHLGMFESPEDAHHAYMLAKKTLHEFSTIASNVEGEYTLPPIRVFTSSYVGVSWDNQRRKWLAQLRVNGKKSGFIGRFDTEEEAHHAYIKAKTISAAG